MGLTFTYTSLVTAIGQYTLEGVTAIETTSVSNGQSIETTVILNNGSFQDALPTIINLAEERIIRELNSNIFDVEVMGTLTQYNPYLAIPNSYLGIRYLMVQDDNENFIPLRRHDITWIENYWRNPSLSAFPEYYGVWGNDGQGSLSGSFQIAPIPDESYPYKLRYIQRPATISIDTPTTWLSTHAADCLLYACLAESMAYLREDIQSEAGMTQMFEAKYRTEVEKLKKELSNQIITGIYF